ncbi:PQ-loop repeat-containing protein [Candidatus Babeliales bacterium]|nr:PQ-loop repeat-containing protein [Candidatus Babeliales bacterium]
MMNNLVSNFAALAIWVAQILFFAGLLPQIILNYKLKSTKGLSEFLLFGYLNGTITYLYYIFCCNLPFAYKAIMPMVFLAVIIMIFQRFYYSEMFFDKEYKILFFYILNILVYIFLFKFFIQYQLFGIILGWITALIWGIYQLPQVIKIFKDKTIIGFSFLLAFLVGFGNLIEFIASINLRLPLPTALNAFRGFLIFLIFCLQFWIYRNPSSH